MHLPGSGRLPDVRTRRAGRHHLQPARGLCLPEHLIQQIVKQCHQHTSILILNAPSASVTFKLKNFSRNYLKFSSIKHQGDVWQQLCALGKREDGNQCPPLVIDMTQAISHSHQHLSAMLQGVPATLCASIILINPIAKLALTMEPVAAATTAAVAQKTAGQLQICFELHPQCSIHIH